MSVIDFNLATGEPTMMRTLWVKKGKKPEINIEYNM